jgi:hypothetical protein
VYIGADEPLAPVPWNPDDPGFHVVPLNEDERPLRGHFRARHVLYAGAHGGCGCGFVPPRGPAPADPEAERASRRASLVAFARYLREQLTRLRAIELHVCHDADPLDAPVVRRELTPEEIESDEFMLLPAEHSVVVSAHAAPAAGSP